MRAAFFYTRRIPSGQSAALSRIALLTLLALPLGGCAGLGLPFDEAGAGAQASLNRPARAIPAAAVVVEIVGVIWARGPRGIGVDMSRMPTPTAADYSNTRELGHLLYGKYAYPFELAAVLLLVAIVAAISLTMRKRPGHKVQDINAQVAVRAQDRIRIIKMEAEKK